MSSDRVNKLEKNLRIALIIYAVFSFLLWNFRTEIKTVFRSFESFSVKLNNVLYSFDKIAILTFIIIFVVLYLFSYMNAVRSMKNIGFLGIAVIVSTLDFRTATIQSLWFNSYKIHPSTLIAIAALLCFVSISLIRKRRNLPLMLYAGFMLLSVLVYAYFFISLPAGSWTIVMNYGVGYFLLSIIALSLPALLIYIFDKSNSSEVREDALVFELKPLLTAMVSYYVVSFVICLFLADISNALNNYFALNYAGSKFAVFFFFSVDKYFISFFALCALIPYFAGKISKKDALVVLMLNAAAVVGSGLLNSAIGNNGFLPNLDSLRFNVYALYTAAFSALFVVLLSRGLKASLFQKLYIVIVLALGLLLFYDHAFVNLPYSLFELPKTPVYHLILAALSLLPSLGLIFDRS